MAESIQRLRMDQSATYRIKLQGRLNDEWSNWIRGMDLTLERTTEGMIVTMLTGPVDDQAELYGLLA